MRQFTIAVLLCSAISVAQSRKSIDWKPCQTVANQFKQQVKKFNADHKDKDGFRIELICSYSGDPNSPKRKQPEQIVHLTIAEIEHLHELRIKEHAGYAAMAEYEDYLFKAHHVRKPNIEEPCYYFVGIKVNDDFITVDPTPFDPECD